MEVIRFKPGVFRQEENDVHWHCWGSSCGQEFTLCGMAFEGLDGQIDGPLHDSKQGKITCPVCIEIIKFCKSIKAKDIKRLR